MGGIPTGMTNDLVDIEAYVLGVDPDALIQALNSQLGALYFDCDVDAKQKLYVSGDLKLLINSGIQDDFVSVWIRGNARWKTNVELARFLSERLGCLARCDPGSEYPNVSPHSDTFLEISNGKETLIEWQ